MPSSAFDDFDIILDETLLQFFDDGPFDDLELDDVELKEVWSYARGLRSDKGLRWSPPQPSSDAFIWRYLNFTQLLSICERDQIWFTKVNQFEDPYEGSLPLPNLEAEVEDIAQEFDIAREAAIRIHRLVFRNQNPSISGVYVNCWNVSEHQSAALWEQYVDSPQGVAIRTTVEKLRQSLSENDNRMVYGNVEYIEYDKESIPEGDIPAIYHKRKSFEHEHEFRIAYNSKKDEDLGIGFYADVDTDTLLDRIVISPLAPDWFSELVERVLERYELDCDLKESGLYSDPDVTVK